MNLRGEFRLRFGEGKLGKDYRLFRSGAECMLRQVEMLCVNEKFNTEALVELKRAVEN
jgi:hypothetical protein